MNDSTQKGREKIVFRLSLGIAMLILLVVFLLTGFQTYVRWFINQNFTLVGGNELEVLTISGFALIIALAYIHRPSKEKE